MKEATLPTQAASEVVPSVIIIHDVTEAMSIIAAGDSPFDTAYQFAHADVKKATARIVQARAIRDAKLLGQKTL